FDLLTSLVQKSLVNVEYRGDSARYRLLETVRRYALERLTEAGEARSVQERHAAYVRTLVEREEPRLVGPEQPRAMGRLAAEIDNVRAALTFAQREDQVALGAALATRLWRFWFLSGRAGEGRDWLARIIEASDALPPLMRARLL